jgi:hypothetical protein
MERSAGRNIFYTEAMKASVLYHIKNDKLIKWIKQNDFLEKIKVIK